MKPLVYTRARALPDLLQRRIVILDEGKATDVLAAARAVAERVKKKTPFQQSEIMMINGGNPQMIAGHPANLLEKYNDLVKASNNLKF